MKPFFVYMLRCRDGSYYVGHTDDLERRMAQHHDGTFGGHSARKRPVTLVWCHDTATREEALERELQLKRWTRAKKEALIRDDWSTLKRLARGCDRHLRERSSRAPRPPFDSAPGAAPAANNAGRYAQGKRGKGKRGERGPGLEREDDDRA
jgi:predicted GIY-YIG superfamily endonuclease